MRIYRVWTKTEVVRPESFPQSKHAFMFADLDQDIDSTFVLLGSVSVDLHVLDSGRRRNKLVSMDCGECKRTHLVLAISTGIEATVVTKPLIILAVKCMKMPSVKYPLLTSICLACEYDES